MTEPSKGEQAFAAAVVTAAGIMEQVKARRERRERRRAVAAATFRVPVSRATYYRQMAKALAGRTHGYRRKDYRIYLERLAKRFAG